MRERKMENNCGKWFEDETDVSALFFISKRRTSPVLL